MRGSLSVPIRALLTLAVTTGWFCPVWAQEWQLNASASHFYMQTVKANSIFEVHQFTGLDGSISRDGDASVKIDLTSVVSGIDVRDVRMRFLLFETYKFPYAEITAKLDMAALQALLTTTRITYPLKIKVALHGVTQDIETAVTVTRLGDKSVSVVSVKPIVVTTDAFGLTPSIAKLSDAINGSVIATGATFTFDLLFESGDKIPALRAAHDENEKRKIAAENAPISAEACETPFDVISTAGAVHFKASSAELDTGSDAFCKVLLISPTVAPRSKSRSRVTPTRSAPKMQTFSSPSSGHTPSSNSCRNAASPPRASKRPAMATRGPSHRTIRKPIGPKTAASNSAC